MTSIDTLPKAFLDRAQKKPERTAMRWKHLGIWRDITWFQYLEKVKQVALGLHALGVRRGDHVAIIGENKPEWLYCAFGAMCSGAVYAGIYTTSPANECEYVVGHSGSVVYLCEDEEQFDKALEFRDRTPALRKMIVWDMEGLRHFQDPMLMSFDELLELGRKTDAENPGLFVDLISRTEPEDTAGIIYTSGTTGMPKGAMLTQEGCLWMGQKVCQVARIAENDETISFLPLNHIFEQIFDFLVHIVIGHVINFTENTDTVMSDMKDISPTIFHAVPRIWEKYHSGIVLRMDDATWFKRLSYRTAIRIGTAYNDLVLSGRRPSPTLAAAYRLASFAVFRKLKKRLGFDRIRLGISGAAPISHNILRYFQSMGIPIREGYGLTETTGVTHMSDIANFKVGKVGKALPETEVRIAEDGEILVRHKAIIKGYYKDDEATRNAIVDGWLHTGDVGEVDEEGYLKITDRKKDLIITAGGKNIAPQYIENLLKFSPYINDAVIIGDRRKYITALIVIDEDNVVKYAQDHKVQYTTFASLTRAPEIVELIQREIDQVNAQMARVENIRKFRILDKKLYTEDGEVTPTMKVKRKAINAQFGDVIEDMYRED